MAQFIKTVLLVALLPVVGRISHADEAETFRAKAQAMKSRAAEFAENGHEEKAKTLRQEADALIASSQAVARLADTDKEVAHLRERLEDLRAARVKAEQEDRSEAEQNELREQIQNIERKLHQVLEGRVRRDREVPPPFREQFEKLEHAARRIHHIRKAAENLKAAELHELARDLVAKAEAMENDVRTAKQELTHAMSGSDKQLESNEAVRQLKAENAKLRQELNELREAVQQLKQEQAK